MNKSLVLALSVSTALSASAAQTNLNGRTFTLPDGFTVELVARAPLVNRPISIAFDERGRLYATDSSGSSDKGPTQYERKDHRIVRLEDTDGDGRFDKSVVFADKLMFPEGAMFYEGSLYVAAPPQIWKLTDTDGDGVADKREVWHDGKTLTGCANDLHGPYLGPDGWFYWCKGAFAEQRYTLPNGKPFVSRASHIFRARPDGTGIEPVLTGGMDNPVGVAFHSTGECSLSCTFVQPGGGKRDGLLHAIYGGVYGKEQSALDGHPRTGDLMPVMTHMGAAAPCGLTTYRSRVFGADWADNLLACYFNLRKVVRHELIPDGATFKTRDTDLLASDHLDFHPTDVLEDADGSILIVDTGGWYKICCPTSQLAKPDVLGAIYRVRKVGIIYGNRPRGLGHAQGVRDHAARLGLEVAYDGKIGEETDYGAVGREAKAAGAEVLLWDIEARGAAKKAALQAVCDAGFKPSQIWLSEQPNPAGSEVTGLFSRVTWAPNDPSPKSQKFYNDFKRLWGVEPEYHSAGGYACGEVLAQGHTQRVGEAHAEVMALRALRAAGHEARGCTVYVTLEPCAHHGRTPPCCDALIEAGVARVVVAQQDLLQLSTLLEKELKPVLLLNVLAAK